MLWDAHSDFPLHCSPIFVHRVHNWALPCSHATCICHRRCSDIEAKKRTDKETLRETPLLLSSRYQHLLFSLCIQPIGEAAREAGGWAQCITTDTVSLSPACDSPNGPCMAMTIFKQAHVRHHKLLQLTEIFGRQWWLPSPWEQLELTQAGCTCPVHEPAVPKASFRPGEGHKWGHMLRGTRATPCVSTC